MPIEYGLGASAIDYDGKNIYVRITDIDDETSQFDFNKVSSPSFYDNKYLLNNGDILVARTGASVGKSYLHDNMSNSYFAGFLMRIRVSEHHPYYIYSQLKTNRFKKWLQVMSIRSGQPGINSKELGLYKIHITDITNEEKIGNILKCVDQRIITQKKIIDNLNSLINSIINHIYSINDYNAKLSDVITQSTNKNKNGLINYVSSVSNKYGFIKQSEQFEDRDVASDDLSNYKVVTLNDFGYNPARINVGSIARYKNTNDTVVSPMYICFKCKNNLYPEYLEYYFKSKEFKIHLLRRLEGSVRQCLTFESMQNIPFHLPNLDEQKKNAKIISALFKKIQLETSILNKLILQKDYLLSKMFI